VELGLEGGHAGERETITLPMGESPASLWEQGQGWQWVVDRDSGGLSALGRPSWLLHLGGLLSMFLRLFYYDTEWTGWGDIVGDGDTLLPEGVPVWTPHHDCILRFIRTNGIALSLWVNG